MTYWYQPPHPLLSGYVKTVLVIDGSAPARPTKVPLFTGGMPALVWRVEQDATDAEHTAQLSLFAKSPPATSLGVDAYATVIVFFFMPFVLPCIFNISATSLMRETVTLKNGPVIPVGNEDPVAAKASALNDLVIKYLNTNKRNCEIIKCATDELMNNNGPEILLKVQQELSLSERSFQRIFKKFVGITPNQYRRICQFDHSFSQLRTLGFDKLADVAYDNGFADQSHFIRTFKEFTNVNPGAYLRSGLTDKEK